MKNKKTIKAQDVFKEKNINNKFTLITGCMFAGKSKKIIEMSDGIDFEAFSPTVDTRDNCIRSRALKKTIPCKKVSRASEIESKAQTIIIDEYQFLPLEDLIDFVREAKKEHNIIMAGLDLLADQTPWANYEPMSYICDEEIKLKATCSVCGEHTAKYSKKISGTQGKNIDIEGQATYEPRCRNCY